jgi:hypothetical protein
MKTRIDEITPNNNLTAELYKIDFNLLNITCNSVIQLINDILIKDIPNFAYISIEYIELVKIEINYFLDRSNNFIDKYDPDLINLIQQTEKTLIYIDRSILAMRHAKLIK